MKTIPTKLLISLVPLLSPMSAFAEQAGGTQLATPIPGTKGSAASWRASQVMGLNVKNSGDETIGEVEDLVLDMKAGKILAVVISSGGFLGMADTLSAVPVSALRYDTNATAFKTELTKAQLGKAPQFKKEAWPDYNDAASIQALDTYGETIGDDVENADVDNTAQNKKEMRADAVDPTSQGNSDKDIQITKDIRSSIMDTELSFNAKNIKIITSNEHVVLKGVVESDTEHQAVLKIARNHANSGKITDNLEVNSK